MEFTPAALLVLADLSSKLQYFASAEDYSTMLTQLLPLDIRSVRQGRGDATGEGLRLIVFSTLDSCTRRHLPRPS